MVRPATGEDLPQIWSLIQGLAEYERLAHAVTGTVEDLRRWLFEEPVASCLVSETEGGLVGYALYFTTFSTFRTQPGIWLEDVFVLPEHRAKGIGTALIHAVLGIARKGEYGRVEWSVLDWNEPAIDFYRKLGAEVLPDWRICRICPGET